MATIEEIRAKLLANQNKGKGKEKTGGGGDNAVYPFWNIPEGSNAPVRFLPDGDPDNTFFWVPRETIKMKFQGVVGGDYPTNREVTVTVPCVEMFGMACPVVAAIRPWWKDPAKEALARLYWKKKSYIFQGFVVSSPFEEQNVPENPIRRFTVNPSIYTIIEKSIIDPDMADMPTDFVGGRDFKIAKTRQGEYANYGTSSWSMKVRSLGDKELAAIEKYGLHDLKQFQGRRPDQDELDAIKAMFEASVAGDPFDMASFGQWYRPYGGRDDDSAAAPARTTSTSAQAPARTVSSEPTETVTETATSAAKATPSTADLLERIRQRSNKS